MTNISSYRKIILNVVDEFPVHGIYLDIYLSVLAVLDEDEQTLVNVNIVDKEKVRSFSMILIFY